MNRARLKYLVENGTDEELLEEFKNIVGKYYIFNGEKKRVIGVQRVVGVVFVTSEDSEGKALTINTDEFYEGFERLV